MPQPFARTCPAKKKTTLFFCNINLPLQMRLLFAQNFIPNDYHKTLSPMITMFSLKLVLKIIKLLYFPYCGKGESESVYCRVCVFLRGLNFADGLALIKIEDMATAA